jgi:5'-nucleotidase
LATSLQVALDGSALADLPVTDGAAQVDVVVPASTSAGAHTLTRVASPGGTTVTLPVTVEVPVSGKVEFVSGVTVLGTATVTKGVARFRLPTTTAVGSYPVVARYAGVDQVVLGSQSEPVTVTVRAIATTTGLLVSSSTVSQRSW